MKAWKAKFYLGLALLFSGILLIIYRGSQLLVLGTPLVVAGLVLLTTVPHGKKKDEMPSGVAAVGVLAFFASMAFTFVGIIQGELSLRAFTSSVGWYLAVLGVLALAGLSLSILVIRGVSSKYLWFALMGYWISMLFFSFIRDFILMGYLVGTPFYPFLFPTYVYAASGIIYFLTKKPRQYYFQQV
jgi:hypothetical protein